MINVFEGDRLYKATDPEMVRVFESPLKLTQWRCRGRGPAYTKIGRTPVYLGHDLNMWLDLQRQTTKDTPQ